MKNTEEYKNTIELLQLFLEEINVKKVCFTIIETDKGLLTLCYQKNDLFLELNGERMELTEKLWNDIKFNIDKIIKL